MTDKIAPKAPPRHKYIIKRGKYKKSGMPFKGYWYGRVNLKTNDPKGAYKYKEDPREFMAESDELWLWNMDEKKPTKLIWKKPINSKKTKN